MRSIALVLLLCATWCWPSSADAENACIYKLVESIPEGVNFTSDQNPTPLELPLIKDELIDLVNHAMKSIDVAEFYFTLKCSDVFNKTLPTCQAGEKLLQSMIHAASSGIQVRIAVNGVREKDMNEDLVQLESAGAQIRFVDFTSLVGAGVLHTKMMIFDDDKFFLGSANMDWRSLTQVKEIGIVTNRCPLLTNDLSKIFEVYWLLGGKKKLPDRFPPSVSTPYNLHSPMSVLMNGRASEVFLSSSPASFCAAGRTNDLEALLSVVNRAYKFLDLSVMDYAPMFLYSNRNAYWDRIDAALRSAVVSRGVRVRFLLGYWEHTRDDILKYLASLDQLREMTWRKGNLEVRLFKVPYTDPSQKSIPFARVDHAKFMVSDSHAFIGTSNWSADYFVNTGGVSLIASCQTTDGDCIRDQLQAVFDRDWSSQYAYYLNHTQVHP